MSKFSVQDTGKKEVISISILPRLRQAVDHIATKYNYSRSEVIEKILDSDPDIVNALVELGEIESE